MIYLVLLLSIINLIWTYGQYKKTKRDIDLIFRRDEQHLKLINQEIQARVKSYKEIKKKVHGLRVKLNKEN